jgi:hypothetical protein
MENPILNNPFEEPKEYRAYEEDMRISGQRQQILL